MVGSIARIVAQFSRARVANSTTTRSSTPVGPPVRPEPWCACHRIVSVCGGTGHLY